MRFYICFNKKMRKNIKFVSSLIKDCYFGVK